jgi:hypothetical protein
MQPDCRSSGLVSAAQFAIGLPSHRGACICEAFGMQIGSQALEFAHSAFALQVAIRFGEAARVQAGGIPGQG